MYRILFIFIFLSSFVFGATNIPDNHIIYTWGYGKMIYQVLEAVAMAVQNAGQLIKSVLLLAFAFVAIKKILDGRMQYFAEVVKFSVISALLIGFFIHAPNSDSNRFQVFDEAIAETYVVERIPSGLGMLFAAVSQVERSLLKLMELSFSTPNSISIRNAGFGFSMETINTLKNMKPIFLDPLWVENMNNFIGVCLHYNAEKDPTLMRRIITSNDLYNDLLGMKAGFPIGNTISVNMIQAEGRGVKETIVPCRVLGAELQKGLEGQTENLKKIHMAQLGIKHIEFYDDKMQGVANLFHTSHANARNMLQQVMLVHSYRDGIKNMERMYGLGEGTLATTSSIAHYAFFNQMIQQSTLAQKFLPLMKAFLTAIIIGVSWLIIIFSIITGLRSLMMILTMSLFLIFWTPILGLTNYLNDIFLEDKFQTFLKYTNGMFGFNINFNTEFFMAIQEHAAIIGYLVMLTPVLAYGLAKGSDMAISSMVSGFTSALSSGARAGALESTKQAQSTKSDIAIGEEVYSKQAGIREVLGTNWANGMATQQQTKLDEFGNPINSKVNVGYGASFELSKDESGNIHYTNAQSGQIGMQSIQNYATAQAQSSEKSLMGALQKTDTNGLNAIYQTAESSGFNQNSQAIENIKQSVIDSVKQSENFTKAEKDAIAFALSGSGSVGFSKPFLFASAEAKIAGSLGISTESADALIKAVGKEKASQIAEDFSMQYAKSAIMDKNVATSLAEQNSTMQNNSLTEALTQRDSFVSSQQVSNAMSNNDLSGAIRQRAEQLAMEDGLRLNISGEMELHQKYGSKAFSQMIQESQQHELSNSHINTSPMDIYNKNNNVNPDELFAQGQNKVKGNDNINQQKLESERDNKLDRKIDKHEQGKEGVEKHLSKANSNTGVYNYENIPLVGDLVKKAFPDKNSLNGKDFINDIFSRQ